MRKQSEVRHTIPIQVRCQPNPFAESVCLSVADEFETDAPGLYAKGGLCSLKPFNIQCQTCPKCVSQKIVLSLTSGELLTLRATMI